MTREDVAYKWKRLFASKAFGGKVIELSPLEAQELIDDIEGNVYQAAQNRFNEAVLLEKESERVEKLLNSNFSNSEIVDLLGLNTTMLNRALYLSLIHI